MNEQILQNPITIQLQNSINNSKQKLNFAVPFISSFALSVLNENNTNHITDKRLLTRFEDRTVLSFDVPTLKKLKDLGFKIFYDNTIHLKLYITDNDSFVTSSNLTQGGFEKNVELTIRVDSENAAECDKIFNELWHSTGNKELTDQLLLESWAKYYFLKKRDDSRSTKKRTDLNITTIRGEIDIEKVINEIFNLKENYSTVTDLTFKASQVKEQFKNKLHTSFNRLFFYAHDQHPMRRENLFYDFTYGHESNIASTGLRELQFRTAFEHTDFPRVIEYIYPEIIGMKPWNFEDKDEMFEFCCGIFDFKIPQYTEALPIRLASYFYPDYFLPIFKLDHLRKVSDALGIETNAKTKGEKLFAYTTHITQKMRHLPHNNNIKSNIAYNVLYTVELKDRLQNGENYENILADYKQNWKKRYIANGRKVLKTLGFIIEK